MTADELADAPHRRVTPGRVRSVLVLATLAYLPALTAAPGRMPSDSKLYLYLDPGRFFADAASSFDPRQFAGWVPHQHIAYLWPGLPWYWTFETLGVPDWIAHRLWIGTVMLVAGLGARWLARLLGLGATSAVVAAIAYQLTLYVLPYVSRTSVMLLPWAGLGWIVGFTIRAARRGGWGDPAAVALVVLTVGAVNATALAMIVPAPVLWLVHAAWQRTVTWRSAVFAGLRIGALCAAVSVWWVVMLVVQSRAGTDVLPYSESLADVSLTASAPETWRSLGYWLFYVRDPFAAATTESLRYQSSTVSIALSYSIPVLALVSLAFVRWGQRRFAALLIGTGLVLAVGVHPIDDRSPLMRILAGDDESGLALALRSSTRALPLVALGSALALAAAVDAAGRVDWIIPRVTARQVSAAVVGVLAVANLPALWTGGFVDPALERDESPPDAWTEAAAFLDGRPSGSRVLQLPGAEFGAFRWGYTVDQPLPGLVEAPLVTRDLLPLGSAAAMDLVYALDDRLQDGVAEPASIAPVAQLLGVDSLWLANDLAFDRFRTARPDVVRAMVDGAPGTGDIAAFGDPTPNQGVVAMRDEREIGDPHVGGAMPTVEIVELIEPGQIVRARTETVVVAGSGDGLVDAAAAGLIDPSRHAVRYAADLDAQEPMAGDAAALVVTDSNRDRARHWRSSQDVTGFTETGGPDSGVLRPVSADARLPLFDTDDPSTQTVAIQEGPVSATATSYGEPFAYLPEHRPYAAIDGSLDTAWLVGEHADPVGETLRLSFERPVERVVLHQHHVAGNRSITEVDVVGWSSDDEVIEDRLALDQRSRDGSGQEVLFDTAVTQLDLRIVAVGGGEPFTASAVAPVGFREVTHDLRPTVEVTHVPRSSGADDVDTPLGFVFTRLRSDPMDRWRDDPESTLVRSFETSTERTFDVESTVRIDARATDAELAAVFDWPAVATSRLTGSLRHAGVAALDGDPETAWVTGFGEALGATLSTSTSVPISSLTVEQPTTGFSTVTQLTIRNGSDVRVVDLVETDTGSFTGTVDPPVPAGPVEFEVAGVRAADTIDRRFGDTVTLPAAVSEMAFAGRPTVEPVASIRGEIGRCVPLFEIDGTVVEATLTVVDDGWLDGAPIEAVPCRDALVLSGGSHLLAGAVDGLPVQLDRVVLDDRVRTTVADFSTDETPVVTVVDDGRFSRSIDVSGCDDGCWLVFGEGFNEGWSATIDGRSLGEPVLIDGGFNGWYLPPGSDGVTVEVDWAHQRTLTLAIVVSFAAALVCVALVVLGRRRPHEPASVGPPPRLVGHRTGERSLDVVAAVAWPVVAGLVVGPVWSVWALLGSTLILLRPRTRWPELVAMATVATVALVVVVRERRNAPPPGGGWPGEFADLHGPAMFAVACVLVAALAADDAGATESEAPVDTLADDVIDA